REAVARPEIERAVESEVVLVDHDEQPRQAGVHLLGGEPVGMRVKPVQAGAVAQLEGQAPACARRDRVEACAVLRLRERQAVEVQCRRLRQRVLDDRIKALAAAREENRLRNPAPADIGDVPAAAEQRIDALGNQTPHCAQRNHIAGGKEGALAAARPRPPERRAERKRAGEKASPVQRTAGCAGHMRANTPSRFTMRWRSAAATCSAMSAMRTHTVAKCTVLKSSLSPDEAQPHCGSAAPKYLI